MSNDADIDPVQFGFAKMKYAAVERERRWLCADLPAAAIGAATVYDIEDTYIPDTQLRLRETHEGAGRTSRWPRLSRKADMDDPGHRLITSIYLSDSELDLLRQLPGNKLRKTRYKIVHDGQDMGIDVFDGPLDGLILAEAEFDDDASMMTFPSPDFTLCEVTNDSRFSGGTLSALSPEQARRFIEHVLHDA